MKFNEAFNTVMTMEGGSLVHEVPGDPGGLTKWGVSQRAYPDLDIANLTEHEARLLYREDYWNKVKCDDVPAIHRLPLFDSAVNQGVRRAQKLYQKALRDAGYPMRTIDGIIGPHTIVGTIETSPLLVLDFFMARRAKHYASLPTFPKFGKGWLRRLFFIQRMNNKA